jgi:hemerythrin
VEKNGWELKWSDFLTVGVPEMDEEHKKFISQVNELTKAVLECRDKAVIRRLMDSMLTEAADHFRNEEQLLVKWNYPDRAVHAMKHVQLTAQLNRVKNEFETPAISFMGALKGLQINQMLIDHLLKEDMKYRDFLRIHADPGKSPRDLAAHDA